MSENRNPWALSVTILLSFAPPRVNKNTRSLHYSIDLRVVGNASARFDGEQSTIFNINILRGSTSSEGQVRAVTRACVARTFGVCVVEPRSVCGVRGFQEILK